MILRRTAIATGAIYDAEVKNLRDAEARVAWCGSDNLLLSRRDASAVAVEAGTRFRHGEPYELDGEYRFELVKP